MISISSFFAVLKISADLSAFYLQRYHSVQVQQKYPFLSTAGGENEVVEITDAQIVQLDIVISKRYCKRLEWSIFIWIFLTYFPIFIGPSSGVLDDGDVDGTYNISGCLVVMRMRVWMEWQILMSALRLRWRRQRLDELRNIGECLWSCLYCKRDPIAANHCRFVRVVLV